MVLFNYAIREITAKLVYYGPGLGGKTTNLQKIHEGLDTKSRGKMISLATDADRTLFFDFLPIDLGNIGGYRVRFQLYTVPGQVHYNATRKLVLKGVDAIVFVADSQIEMIERNKESYENLRENLAENGYDLGVIPIVYQFNKQDLPNVATPEELAESLGIDLEDVIWHESVAVDGKGVFETLKSIIKLTISKLRAQFEEGEGRTVAPKGKPSAAKEIPSRKARSEQPVMAEEPGPAAAEEAPAVAEEAPAVAEEAPAVAEEAPAVAEEAATEAEVVAAPSMEEEPEPAVAEEASEPAMAEEAAPEEEVAAPSMEMEEETEAAVAEETAQEEPEEPAEPEEEEIDLEDLLDEETAAEAEELELEGLETEEEVSLAAGQPEEEPKTAEETMPAESALISRTWESGSVWPVEDKPESESVLEEAGISPVPWGNEYSPTATAPEAPPEPEESAAPIPMEEPPVTMEEIPITKEEIPILRGYPEEIADSRQLYSPAAASVAAGEGSTAGIVPAAPVAQPSVREASPAGMAAELAYLREKIPAMEKTLAELKLLMDENRILMNKVIDIAVGRMFTGGEDRTGLPAKRGFFSRLFGGPPEGK